jgi:diacylglycerol kinase family enzyme
VPLAVVATGTANDFARETGLPRDLDAACALAADPGARTVTFELARAGERPFVNAASCGLSVVAAHRATPLKPRLGPLAYAAGALRAGLTGRPVDARVQVEDGETVHDGPAWQVIVGATGAFGAGSGIEEADPRDHLLDVVVVPAGSRAALVRHAFGLRTGRIARQRGVVHARARAFTIATPAQTEWNIDGEVCDPASASFANHDEAYEVVMP